MEYTEEHLIELLDMTNYSINVKDKDKKYQYINEQFKNMIKKNFQVLKKIDDNVLGKTAEETRKGLEIVNKCAYILEVENRKVQVNIDMGRGKKIMVETYSIPIYDDNKEVIGSVGLSEEVKDSFILQTIVKPTYKKIQNLTNLILPIDEVTDIDKIVGVIAKQLSRVLKSDHLSVYCYNYKEEKLEKYMEEGLTLGNNEISIDEKILNSTFKNKVINFVEYNRYDKNFKYSQASLEEAGIDYIGMYPLKFKGRIWGTINIGYKKENSKPYSRIMYVKELCEKIEWTVKNQFLIEYVLKEFRKEREIEDDLSLFFDSAVDCLMILDEHSKIKQINSFWAEKLGFTKEELKGKSIYEFIYKEDREQTRLSLRKKGLKNSYNRYFIKDGSIRWMKWQVGRIKSKKNNILVGVGIDVQEEKLAEKRRIELKKSLERERYRNLFFSTLSHEFKTPLNIILASLQLIKQNLTNQPQSEDIMSMNKYMYIISRNAYKTLKVANDLIDIIKMDTRSEKLNYKYYNIVDVVEEITLKVADYIKEIDKTILFDTDIEELPVWCDEEAIERIILNLLSNAIKYSPAGGKILVRIKELSHAVYVWVEDEGLKSIAQEDEIDVGKIIWNTQLSGLGLKIADQLVGLHKGKVVIEKKNPKGSIVGFTLPIEENYMEKECIYRGNLDIRQQESCNRELCDI